MMPPDSHVIEKAADIIRSGGVIAFPTTCLYGLGADARNGAAVSRIFRMKKRSPEKPILVLIHSFEELKPLVLSIPGIAKQLMDKFWPGKLTLVMKAAPSLPRELTAGTGKIGIRMAGHPVAVELIRQVGGPVTGTSANISGNAGCERIERLDRRIAAKVDMILDAGQLPGGRGSTIVDCTGSRPFILREGILPAEAIRRELK